MAAAPFFLLTLVVAFGAGLPVAAATHGHLPVDLPVSLMLIPLFSPALAALLLAHRSCGRAGLRALWARLTHWQVAPGWYLVAVGLPFAVNGLALGLGTIGGAALPELPGAPAPEQQIVPIALLPLVLLVPSLAEELGWRGYALPLLQGRHSAFAASLVIGAVWAVWHLPLALVADSTQGHLPFAWYLPHALALAVVFTWLFNSTGQSVVAVTLLHASVQAANIVLPVLPDEGGAGAAYRASVAVIVLLAGALVARAGPRTLTSRPGAHVGARSGDNDSERSQPRRVGSTQPR